MTTISVQFWVCDDCVAVLELPAVPRVGEYVKVIGSQTELHRVESVRWIVGRSAYTIQVVLEPTPIAFTKT